MNQAKTIGEFKVVQGFILATARGVSASKRSRRALVQMVAKNNSKIRGWLNLHINKVGSASLSPLALHPWQQDGSGVKSVTTDPRVPGSSLWHDQTFTQREESHQLSVIPGVRIARCGQIKRKDQNTAH